MVYTNAGFGPASRAFASASRSRPSSSIGTAVTSTPRAARSFSGRSYVGCSTTTRAPAKRSARNARPCSEPFVTRTREGSTPCRSAIHSRSGWYPPTGPYESTVVPSRWTAARAQSASSATGMHSGAGTPRASEIVSTARVYGGDRRLAAEAAGTARRGRSGRSAEPIQDTRRVGAEDLPAGADDRRHGAPVRREGPELLPGRGVEREESARLSAGREHHVPGHERRRLASVSHHGLPDRTEAAARVDVPCRDAVAQARAVAAADDGLADVDHLLRLGPCRRADERSDPVAERQAEQRAVSEVIPIPDVERAVLVVRGCERRARARVEQERSCTEVRVAGRRNSRVVGVEHLGEIRKEVHDVVAVARVVDVAPALVRPHGRVSEGGEHVARGRVDGHAAPAPHAAHVGRPGHRIPNGEIARVGEGNGEESPFRQGAAGRADVAVGGDADVEAIGGDPQTAPDVLVHVVP